MHTGSLKLIALAGPKGSGKSHIAKLVTQNTGGIVLSFAGPIKAMLAKAEILPPEAFLPEHKENTAHGRCGKSPRYLMQTLGTEWGRQIIGEDIWVETVVSQIKTLQAAQKHPLIVIDDLRFGNEAKAIVNLGGKIYRVRRAGFDYTGEHASEQPIPEQYIEGELVNDQDPIPWEKVCQSLRLESTA
jgi:hypothetical protein